MPMNRFRRAMLLGTLFVSVGCEASTIDTGSEATGGEDANSGVAGSHLDTMAGGASEGGSEGEARGGVGGAAGAGDELEPASHLELFDLANGDSSQRDRKRARISSKAGALSSIPRTAKSGRECSASFTTWCGT